MQKSRENEKIDAFENRENGKSKKQMLHLMMDFSIDGIDGLAKLKSVKMRKRRKRMTEVDDALLNSYLDFFRQLFPHPGRKESEGEQWKLRGREVEAVHVQP
uniref:Uncharacterized protein n=1 Tax=Globodera rostochiensis TaxID=31243 RepID=A0A914HDD1_GLORO